MQTLKPNEKYKVADTFMMNSEFKTKPVVIMQDIELVVLKLIMD